MATKSFDQLITEIDAAVSPFNGPPKTTNPGLNALLRSLAQELTNSPAAHFADLLGSPTDNAALAAALLPTGSNVLEFVFEAGFADGLARTLGPRQAATYASEQRQNVASASYQVNGVPAALPLTLGSGDVLQVALTRVDDAQPALLSLLS